MDQPDTCELCGHGLEGTGGHAVAGMTLCSPCNGGQFHDRLVDRGLRVECLGQAYYSFDGFVGSKNQHPEGAVPYNLELTGHFSKEDIFSKVGKWFSKELQVGDAGFDEALYIKTDDPDGLADALRDEGLRAAILHAVKSTDRPVVIEGHKVTFEVTDMLSEEVPRALRDVAMILHQLEHIALERGLPRRQELATYPDLAKTIKHAAECVTVGQKRHWPKGVFVKDAALDTLEGIGQLHDLMVDSKGPLRIVHLKRCHLISGDLSPLSTMTKVRVMVLDRLPAARVLPPLVALEALEELTVAGCSVTDLAPLTGLPALVELWLKSTPVSDLRPIAGIQTLKKLDLRGTRVTDLSPLTRLPRLEMLWLQGLDVPPEQVRALRSALPALELDPY